MKKTKTELSQQLVLVDATLREGEQAHGVKFTLEDASIIALVLDKFGVDILEIGTIGTLSIKQRVVELKKMALKARMLVHCRCNKEEVRAATQMGVPWIGVFCPVNPLGLSHKMKCNRSEALKRFKTAIKIVKKSGVACRATIEDVTRTNWPDVRAGIDVALASGADRIGLADTVGFGTPEKIDRLVKNVRKHFGNIPLEIHCHNDFGLAVANTLAAVKAGINAISVTVGGLGERSGVAPLEQVVASLQFHYSMKTSWKIKQLRKVCETVFFALGRQVPPQFPIVGDNAFCHKAGLHIAAILRDPATYEPFNPEEVGNTRHIVLGRLSGNAAIEYYLTLLNQVVGAQSAAKVLQKIKTDNIDEVTLDQLRTILEEMGKKHD